MVVGMRYWHRNVRLALGDDHLVSLIPDNGHRLALEAGNKVFVQ